MSTNDFDILVVGSGAGGGMLAQACARSGKRVGVLERGEWPDERDQDERSTLIDRRPYDDREYEMNGAETRLYAGGVVGGGTAVYGGALIRASREDFRPGRHYGDRLAHDLWDWPISYDDLEPFYDEAERLLHVTGRRSDDFGPIDGPVNRLDADPFPLTKINHQLVESNRQRGLHPFRLPLAIVPELCRHCEKCAGYVCPTGARRSTAQLLRDAKNAGARLELMTGVEVERLERGSDGSVSGVRVLERRTGRTREYRARRYVLAAGAIGSAVILQRSGCSHPQLGRNYMIHLSPIAGGLFRQPTGADETFVKQVGFADYYLGGTAYPHKLGLIQSLPAPGPLMLRKTLPRFIPQRLLPFLRRHLLPLAGIVEDLPSRGNRVTPADGGKISVTHQFTAYDLERGRRLLRWMKQILRCAGALFSVGFATPPRDHVAHQCGTARFGSSERVAPVAPDCRVFGIPNLFVVDGSIFPTSLGVGPALTIAANALRVAPIVGGEA